MAYMKEKKEHDKLLNLLKKHFSSDEIEEAMRDFKEEDSDDDEYFDEVSDEMEEDFDVMEEYEDEDEEMEVPKDKRKGLAIAVIQKKMSKPKKDMY